MRASIRKRKTIKRPAFVSINANCQIIFNMVDVNELSKSQLYSEELGIDLSKNTDSELFKWFLASILFGTRISETIAKNTYRAFARYNLLSPRKIIAAGWDFLVYPVMREGGYVRYDGKTSTQILRDCAA